MGIKENGLGSLEILRVFYEIELQAACAGVFVQRNACGAQERPACLQAVHGGFITMKLHQSHWNTGAGSYYFRSSCIDEKQDRRHKGRQAASQFSGAFSADAARTGRVHDKAHGIDTGSHGGVHVLFAGESADLDASA